MHWSYVFLELAHHCVPGLVFNWPCLYLRLPSDIEWTYQILYIWPHFGCKQVKYIKFICVPSDEIYVKLVQLGSQYSTMLSLGNRPGCYYLSVKIRHFYVSLPTIQLSCLQKSRYSSAQCILKILINCSHLCPKFSYVWCILEVDWYIRIKITLILPVLDGNSRCRLGSARH